VSKDGSVFIDLQAHDPLHPVKDIDRLATPYHLKQSLSQIHHGFSNSGNILSRFLEAMPGKPESTRKSGYGPTAPGDRCIIIVLFVVILDGFDQSHLDPQPGGPFQRR